MKFKIKILALFLLIMYGRCDELTPPVKTHQGVVVGKYLETVINSVTYAAFKGIPYAKPPLGHLRFKPPVEKKHWENKLHAFYDQERCIQLERGNVVGSEDCLYLNVYTPNITPLDGILKAVMVWIHGGAFRTGNGNSSYYGPDFLIEEDVVVVSIQYRLGALGFLNLNHPGATGNAGLKDQNLALKWIKKNIEFFGGDPHKITLIGQSAGGVSVDFHKLSDMSSGLFDKTISMSASPLCIYWPFQKNMEAKFEAFKLGEKVGILTDNKEDLLEHLMKTPASEIVEAVGDSAILAFRPTLERTDIAPDQPKFLTECSPQKYANGNYNKGPHLMGFTSAEILEFAKTPSDLVKYTTIATDIINENTMLNKLPYVPKILSMPTIALTDLTKMTLTEIIKDLSDIFFVTGIDYKQQLLSRHNDYPVYYYRFDFDSSYSAHKAEDILYLDGTAHEDELPYIFYRPFVNLPLKENSIALMRERLVKMWTNFAKYGDPTPLGSDDPLLEVTWHPSGYSGRHLEIGESLKVGPRPTNTLIEFYQTIGLGDSKVLNDCGINSN